MSDQRLTEWPPGATGVRWYLTNWTECEAVVKADGDFEAAYEDDEHPVSYPGEPVYDLALTGNLNDCACDAHKERRREAEDR